VEKDNKKDDLKPEKDVKIKKGQAKFKSVLKNIIANSTEKPKK